MNTPLTEQYPEAWAAIGKAGFSSLVQMAQSFTSPKLMDAALGYQSACQKWNKGRIPGFDAERRAKAWLDGKAPSPTKTTSGDMLIVVCPEGVSAKATRLLAVLGCEVEAI